MADEIEATLDLRRRRKLGDSEELMVVELSRWNGIDTMLTVWRGIELQIQP